MMFCEKLDSLMKITGTSNSALALYVRLDPSHISRLRHGQRGPIRDGACIDAMAAYFARRCRADYQRNALRELMYGSAAGDEADLRGQIAVWLTDGNGREKPPDRASSGLSPSAPPDAPDVNPPRGEKTACEEKTQITVFYGRGSKRQAAEEFISAAEAQEKPGTLLLFSDEAVEWMTEDAAFSARWAARMEGLLRSGKRICVIHTVNRNLDEMSSAFRLWMPLYMTGLIEPYYCPRVRDGIFRRTLLVLPGTAAVVSSSVGGPAGCEAALFIRDPRMVSAYECEFARFRALCRPLMRIFTAGERKEFLEALDEFESLPENSVIKTESLSLLTMPEAVLDGVLARIGRRGSDLRERHRKRRERLEKQLETASFCEVMRLRPADEIRSGSVSVPLSEMLLDNPAAYTAEEYIAHLEGLLALLRTFDRFDVAFAQAEDEAPYTIYARDETGAFVVKSSAPAAAFAIRERNITASFRDCLRALSEQSSQKEARGKDEKIRRLEAHIEALKKDLST